MIRSKPITPPLTLRDAFRLIRRRWFIVMAGVILGAVSLVGVALLLTPRYVATARFEVTATDYSPEQYGSLEGRISLAEQAASPEALSLLIAQLDLHLTLEDLSSMVLVTASPTDSHLTSTVSGESPDHLAEIANALGRNLDTVIRMGIVSEPPADEGAHRYVNVITSAPAVRPESPAHPNKVVFVSVGAALGLMGGIGVAMLFAWRERNWSMVRNAQPRAEHDV